MVFFLNVTTFVTKLSPEHASFSPLFGNIIHNCIIMITSVLINSKFHTLLFVRNAELALHHIIDPSLPYRKFNAIFTDITKNTY